MPRDRVELLEDRLEAAAFEIVNLRRSVEAQNQIVGNLRREWGNFLDAVPVPSPPDPLPIISPPFSPKCSAADNPFMAIPDLFSSRALYCAARRTSE